VHAPRAVWIYAGELQRGRQISTTGTMDQAMQGGEVTAALTLLVIVSWLMQNVSVRPLLNLMPSKTLPKVSIDFISPFCTASRAQVSNALGNRNASGSGPTAMLRLDPNILQQCYAEQSLCWLCWVSLAEDLHSFRTGKSHNLAQEFVSWALSSSAVSTTRKNTASNEPRQGGLEVKLRRRAGEGSRQSLSHGQSCSCKRATHLHHERSQALLEGAPELLGPDATEVDAQRQGLADVRLNELCEHTRPLLCGFTDEAAARGASGTW